MWEFEKRQRFSIRKKSVGVLSLAIGSFIFLGNAQMVLAKEAPSIEEGAGTSNTMVSQPTASDESATRNETPHETSLTTGSSNNALGDIEKSTPSESAALMNLAVTNTSEEGPDIEASLELATPASASLAATRADSQETGTAASEDSATALTSEAEGANDPSSPATSTDAKASDATLISEANADTETAENEAVVDNSDMEATPATATEATAPPAVTETDPLPGAVGAISNIQKNDREITFDYATGEKGRIQYYSDSTFRWTVDPNGDFPDNPVPNNPNHTAVPVTKDFATFQQDNPDLQIQIEETEEFYNMITGKMKVVLDKQKALLQVYSMDGSLVFAETSPIAINKEENTTTQVIHKQAGEHFYGGGTQNGRFNHDGETIKIVNENRWTDGGVASPNPFYYSSKGYGILRNTFKPGEYAFADTTDRVQTSHHEQRYDAYVFVDEKPVELIKDYQDLTGEPVLLPIFSLYEGHLNAYNRDYWVEVEPGTPGAIFLDGKYYLEYQPANIGDREGVRETLNGEGDSYTFSARRVIERYLENDMPIGWFLPNDGYGAGYGQGDTLDENIANLKAFTDWANEHGVQVGLWTQSDLYPKEGVSPLLQRDIQKEVQEAGVRILKTDVAWVGQGYSFGLNGVDDAANVFVDYGNGARPFIISLDGWAGTQRDAGIWSGDQSGGNWEYIRFHIPTYIGTGLSGNPNVASDMDGIFGGGNAIINTRDYQWKSFTNIMLNMDGWGTNPKNPYAFDEDTTNLNRMYLKLKSELVPYAYSAMHEATDTGMPVMRAMFLEYPDEDLNYTDAVKYQYMFGPNLLVAPVYENVHMDEDGNDVRNGIVLPGGPDTVWIDFYTGEQYTGGVTLNNFEAPIWKLPVFVKNGAIIPVNEANNTYKDIRSDERRFVFYPADHSEYTLYEDDGLTVDYKDGQVMTTQITSDRDDEGNVHLVVKKADGTYDNVTTERATYFMVNATQAPTSVKAKIGGQEVTLNAVDSVEAVETGTNVYYYDPAPEFNRFSQGDGDIAQLSIKGNALLRVRIAATDITQNDVELILEGHVNEKPHTINDSATQAPQSAPSNFKTRENSGITGTTVDLVWEPVEGASYYEVEKDGQIFTNITDTNFHDTELDLASNHHYRIRSVNSQGASEWTAPLAVTTLADPYADAITGIKAVIEEGIPDHAGTPLSNLFDKDLNTRYHSSWEQTSDHYTVTMDLGKAYNLASTIYVPRNDGGTNGRVLQFFRAYSEDGIHWEQDAYWQTVARDAAIIETPFEKAVTARYLRFYTDDTVNDFLSGNELMVMKVPGSVGMVVGDVSGDGQITEDDQTSLLNYAGLRDLDPDFEGYVETADLNKNHLIDAYDINYVLRQLGDPVVESRATEVQGTIQLLPNKMEGSAGDLIQVDVLGKGLQDVNAFSIRIPIDTTKYQVVEDSPVVAPTEATGQMENFSRYRGREEESDLNVIFANKGIKEALNGDVTLGNFTIKLLQDGPLSLSYVDGLLVADNKTFKALSADEEPTDESEGDQSSLIVPATGIMVSGPEEVWQSNSGLDKLIDADVNTLTELKWDIDANHDPETGQLPEEVNLPHTITFDFDGPRIINKMTIHKRINANGTLSKYQVQGYLDGGLVLDTEEVVSPLSQANEVVTFNDGEADEWILVDRVDLIAIEAKGIDGAVQPNMLTLREVAFSQFDYQVESEEKSEEIDFTTAISEDPDLSSDVSYILTPGVKGQNTWTEYKISKDGQELGRVVSEASRQTLEPVNEVRVVGITILETSTGEEASLVLKKPFLDPDTIEITSTGEEGPVFISKPYLDPEVVQAEIDAAIKTSTGEEGPVFISKPYLDPDKVQADQDDTLSPSTGDKGDHPEVTLNPVVKDTLVPTGNKVVEAASVPNTTLPDTGENDGTLLFSAAALSILAGLGLATTSVNKKKEE